MARARQETARAEKDRKEAAIAFRNLGAIAGLRDPKRALEAYETVVELDPDDLESLSGIGEIQIDYGDLNEAQTRLERVLTLAKTDDQAFYKYWALLGLGEIKKLRGDLAGALKAFSDGLAIVARLAESEPKQMCADWPTVSFGGSVSGRDSEALTCSAEQRDGLKRVAVSANRAEADRARAILLSLAGWKSAAIGQVFGVREDTVRDWRSTFMREGLAGARSTSFPASSLS